MDKERLGISAIVNCVSYSRGRRVADVEIEQISHALKQTDHFIWIGLYEPSEELLKEVQQQFCLHDLAIEDAHTAHQRPKVELYGDSLFVVLRTAYMDLEQRRIAFGETAGETLRALDDPKEPWQATAAVPEQAIASLDPAIRSQITTEHGIEVGEPLRSLQGVFTGVPQIVDTRVRES